MQLPDFSGLTGLLSGSGSSSGASGLSLPSTGSTSSSSSGGGMMAAVGSGAAMGAALGTVVPGVGNVVGGVVGAAIGAITSIFGSSGGAPDHERGDLSTIAAANDITADQASWVCGYEQDHSPRNYDDICSQAASDKSYFQSLVVKYNASGTSTPVSTKTAVANAQAGPKYLELQQQLANSFAGTGKASPLANLSFAGAQAAAAQQQMSIGDYLTAIINGALAGAQQGAAGAAAATPAGQAATNDTLAYLAKKYELLIAAAVAGLAFLIYKAFGKK